MHSGFAPEFHLESSVVVRNPVGSWRLLEFRFDPVNFIERSLLSILRHRSEIAGPAGDLLFEKTLIGRIVEQSGLEEFLRGSGIIGQRWGNDNLMGVDWFVFGRDCVGIHEILF